jgi:hypothetical protein
MFGDISRERRRVVPSVVAFCLTATAVLGAHSTAHASSGAVGSSSPTASAASAASKASHRAGAGPLTETGAIARAKATGRAVVADALTTPTSLTTANPDGTVTLTESSQPVRVKSNGAWTALDATLEPNRDGTLSPAATPSGLRLSAGGSGPLAVLDSGGRTLTLTLPVALPKPSVSGATATYANVLPGVDLQVSASTLGAFSDVFVVRNAAAAANPALAGLLDATAATSAGLAISADSSGDLAVRDAEGHDVFTAPTPQAWDSSTTAKGVSPKNARGDDTRPDGSAAAVSSAQAPGVGADVARMPATVRGGHNAAVVHLGVPSSLLAGSPRFPLFLDPTYSPDYGENGWATISGTFPSTHYWDTTPSPDGSAQIGYADGILSRSLFNLPVDVGRFSGANIYGATFGITNSYSYFCPQPGQTHDIQVDISAPDATLTPDNAYWNAWISSLGGNLPSSHSFAHGYPGCAAAAEPFDVTGVVQNDVAAGKGVQTFALHADTESDSYAWKKFQANTANLSVTYDHAPAAPANLYTSPSTTCGADTILGDDSVTLYAQSADPDGGQLTTYFDLSRTGGPDTNLLTGQYGITSNEFDTTSGEYAVLRIPSTSLVAMSTVNGTVNATEFTWWAVTSDGTTTSSHSNSCSFTFDDSRPGAPVIAPTAHPGTGASCPTVGQSSGPPTIVIGTQCSFTITAGAGSTPASYVYQVDQQPPVKIFAGTDSARTAVITATMTRAVNTLEVYGESPGGNPGAEANTAYFDGAPAAAAADGDLNGDGRPDLVVAGNAKSSANLFPPGLWLAPGNANGTVASALTDIGAAGLDFNTSANTAGPTSAADWNGASAITGAFCGTGSQDVLAYFATANGHAGGGAIGCGNGTTGLLGAASGQEYNLSAGTFRDSNQNNATQLANAYNTSAKNYGIPDLFATAGNNLYLFTSSAPAGYSDDSGWGCSQDCDQLSGTPSPDGAYDWNSWTIATAQLSGRTAMYLWKPGTGELDLWTGLALSASGNAYPNATTLAYTQYKIATGWHTGMTTLRLRAAAVNSVPGLWATDTSTGATTSYVPGALSDNPTLTTATTPFTTPAHDWPLNDAVNGAAATATTDQITDTATGAAPANVTEETDGYRQTTVASFDGADSVVALPNGLTSGGTAMTLSLSFQAQPAGTGILASTGHSASTTSIDPAATPLMYIGTDGHLYAQFWTGTVDPIITPTIVNDGQWHTATLVGNGTSQSLYLDGHPVGRHLGAIGDTDPLDFAGAGVFNTKPWVNAPGGTASAHWSYFKGRLADIQYTPSALGPDQLGINTVSALTTGTLYPSGSTWTGASTGMVFDDGVLSITDNSTGATIFARGSKGHPNATLILQTDGNLVIYPGAAQTNGTALWASGTNGGVPNYAVLQADGNFVIYPNSNMTNGTALWSSDTFNTPPPGYFQPVAPTRILDTRDGTGGVDEPLAAGGTLNFTVAGADGIPATGVTGVVLTVTITQPTGYGFITAYPGNSDLPATSNINFAANQTVPNTIVIPVDGDGTINLHFTGEGTVDLIADLSGYFTTNAALAGDSTFVPTAATRILDTRNGTGLGGPFPAGLGARLAVAGTAGIPAGGVTAVAINLTDTNATGDGFLTTWADGAPMPNTSNLTFSAGQTNAITVIVPVGADGKIDLSFHGAGTTDLIGDVAGYFISGTGGQKYHPVWSNRMLDTRNNSERAASYTPTPASEGTSLYPLSVTLITNLTVTGPSDDGDEIAYPDGASVPGSSNVNFTAGQTVANLTMVPTTDNTMQIFNSSPGPTDLIVDCIGYFAQN